MHKYLRVFILIGFYFYLHGYVVSQTVYTTMSGQRVSKGVDGQWVKLEDEIKTFEDSLGMLQTSLNPLEKPEQQKFQYEDYQLLNIKKVKSIAKEQELVFFGDFMNARHDLEETEIKISAAKSIKDESQLKKLETLQKEQKRFIKEKEDIYVKHAMLAVECNNLESHSPNKLDKEIEKIGGILGVSGLIFNNNENNVNAEIVGTVNSLQKDECSVNKIINGKNKEYVAELSDWFSFTPEKLKNYFKDKSLLEAEASFRKVDGKLFLDLELLVASKDASKNYGYVLQGAIFNIKFINDKSITLYAQRSDEPVVESYTGSVRYKVLFPVSKDESKILASVPIDYVGLMWSSGFEKYIIYNVDLAIQQLHCLDKY
ncbi:MAG: hypothetical protein R2774_00725 [Saprospiraceae bacterium]